MQHYLITFLTILLISGCTAAEVATGIAQTLTSEQPTLSIDAQVGDKAANIGTNDNSVINAEDNEGVLTVTSNKSDKQFTGDQEITIQESNSSMELFLYSLGLIGWLLPDPRQIYTEVKSWFTKT